MPILILEQRRSTAPLRLDWVGRSVCVCATDGVKLPPGSVKLNADVWIPPHSVTAQRVSALCLSAFLGQDDHSTAEAHTGTSAATQTDTTVYDHTLESGCLCTPDTQA